MNMDSLCLHNLWMFHKKTIGIVFLVLFSLTLPGSKSEEQSIVKLSNDKHKKDDINVKISESINNLKTVSPIDNLVNVNSFENSKVKESIISSTKIINKKSSYLEDSRTLQADNTTTMIISGDNFRPDVLQSQSTNINNIKRVGNNEQTTPRQYYLPIEPTKTLTANDEHKIESTRSILLNVKSGEAKGVPRQTSGPLKKSGMKKSYKKKFWKTLSRTKRGINDRFPHRSEKYVIVTNDGKLDHKNRKYIVKVEERNKHGSGYNKIEKNLGKIAKVSINEETVVLPGSYRTSRDEENRKANPDIQDIITGIVKILNGNANPGPMENGANRPAQRLQNTRINNRGPPRISDVPPLEFDTPPAFVPLPTAQQPSGTRVPPPYPFDLPPPVSGVPLPPQPNKPGSNLPSHPFIEGVPVPELMVPGNPNKNYGPTSDYDTISMSEAEVGSGLKVPLTITNSESNTRPPLKVHNSSVEHANINSTIHYNNTIRNTTIGQHHNKNDLNKNKLSGQKVTMVNTYNNKTYTKRTRPRPRPTNGSRPTTKPIVNKTEEVTNVGLIVGDSVKNQTVNLTTTDNQMNVSLGETSKTQVNKSEEENFTNLLKTVLSDLVNGSGSTINSQNKDQSNVSKTIEVKHNTEVELELPILLDSSVGFGEATPLLEPSILDVTTTQNNVNKPTAALSASSSSTANSAIDVKNSQSYHSYKARPGIVLDDTEYKPGSAAKRPVIITSRPPQGPFGEVFDVTVHAVQGPGGSSSGKPYIFPVEIEGVKVETVKGGSSDVHVITAAQEGQNFVSIDGKRTYINLFGDSTTSPTISPTSTTQAPITGTGFAVPHKETRPVVQPPKRRPPYKRPSHPPVRIDTCIVGDDSTCDTAQNEMCRTEDGVSSCHCRPGYNRKKHRDPCRRVVSMLTSLRVDRLYDRKIVWHDTLQNPDSEEYHQLSYEANQAIDSAMSMTPFSDDFINSYVNSIYSGKNPETSEPAVYINMTIQLEENLDTMRPAVKHDIQKHLLSVIHRRQNNVGTSAVWVNSPPGSVLALQDLDECSSAELHDCHEQATCSNTFGSFRCQCQNGYRDPWAGNVHRQGRNCETCPSEYCNNKGQCKFEQGQQVCYCTGSFYGAQCEVDGEVLGVAIGASVAAAIIIILTLICLCMWSRRWSREQKSAVGLGMGSPVFGYMASGATVKTPSVGGPPYQVSLEDRIRWAQIADVMAQANHYAQPDPGNVGNRSCFGGYPTLSHTMSISGTLPHGGIIPPVPLPRLGLTNKATMSTYGAHSQHGSLHQSLHGLRTSADTTSSSEEEDRADLLGRNFNGPRPKSRVSVANQSGIYYDVDFERSDMYAKQNSIPLNTYTMNPHQQRPFFR